MVLPREKRRAIAAIYAFARRVDDVADGDAAAGRRSGQRLEQLRAGARRRRRRRRDVRRARATRASRFPIPRTALARARRRRPAGSRPDALRDVRRAARLLLARRGRGRASRASPSTAPTTSERAETLGIALQLINIIRDVPEDWELGRVYLPQDELASFGVSEDDIAAGRRHGCAGSALMTFQADARPRAPAGRSRAAALARRSQRARASRTFAGLYRATLDRIEASGFDVFDGPPHLSALTKLRIVGEGCAGEGGGRRRAASRARAAALELLDAGHEVTLLEAQADARRRRADAAERDGDPAPPPDNGQHIALGCFTEYLRVPRADRRGRLRPPQCA